MRARPNVQPASCDFGQNNAKLSLRACLWLAIQFLALVGRGADHLGERVGAEYIAAFSLDLY